MALEQMLQTTESKSVFLVRLLVGWVFLSEGIQKFLFTDALGVGRFTRIGIPAPQVMAPFVGVIEIICGSLILAGLLVRLASVLLLADISVAILSTKFPIWIGGPLWIFNAPKPPFGFWAMLHEARTDFSMLLGLIFLLIVGAGGFSFDAMLAKRASSSGQTG
jgi:putative oxidoreductase